MKLATRILTLVMAMLMVLSLAACASEPTTTPADTTPSTTDEPADTTVDEPTEEPADTAEEPVDEPADTTEAPETEHRPWIQYITADVCETSNIYNFPLVTDQTTLEFWWPLFSNYVSYNMTTQDDYMIFREMNKLTGIDVEFTIPSDASTQFGLLMASGDIPDFIYGFSSYYSGGLDHAVEEEVAVNLREYEDLMPNLFTVLESNPTFLKEATTDSGYVALVPDIQSNLQGTADRSWMGYVIREDWLNELGMDVPQTYDQLEEVLVAMKGTYCEYPFLLHGMNGSFMLGFGSKFWGGYDIDDSWFQIDGEVKYGPIEDGYRDYIAMLARWYEQGLMSDSFMNASGEGGYMCLFGYEEPCTDDSVGVFPIHYMSVDGIVEANADKPGFGLVGMPFLKRTEDQQLHIGRQAANVIFNHSGSIMVEGGDVELTCQWFDYWFSEDGMLLYNYGLEGETFTFTEDGKPEWIVEAFTNTDPSKPGDALMHQIGFNEPGYHQFDREFIQYSDDLLEVYWTWYNSYDIDYIYPPTASLTAEEGEDYAHIMSDIETYLNENLIQFVLGNRPMSEWEDFRNVLANDMNLDEAMAIKQASLERYNKR